MELAIVCGLASAEGLVVRLISLDKRGNSQDRSHERRAIESASEMFEARYRNLLRRVARLRPLTGLVGAETGAMDARHVVEEIPLSSKSTSCLSALAHWIVCFSFSCICRSWRRRVPLEPNQPLRSRNCTCTVSNERQLAYCMNQRRRNVINIIINSGRIMDALLEETFKSLWFVVAAWLTLPWAVE